MVSTTLKILIYCSYLQLFRVVFSRKLQDLQIIVEVFIVFNSLSNLAPNLFSLDKHFPESEIRQITLFLKPSYLFPVSSQKNSPSTVHFRGHLLCQYHFEPQIYKTRPRWHLLTISVSLRVCSTVTNDYIIHVISGRFRGATGGSCPSLAELKQVWRPYFGK